MVSGTAALYRRRYRLFLSLFLISAIGWIVFIEIYPDDLNPCLPAAVISIASVLATYACYCKGRFEENTGEKLLW